VPHGTNAGSGVEPSMPAGVIAGSGGSHFEDEAQPQEPVMGTAGASSPVQRPPQGGAGHPDPAAPDAASPPVNPSAEPQVEVWIGELWSRQPLLCMLDAPFYPLSLPPEGHSERVVLLLDADSPSLAPTGHIRFGEGELPAVPSPEPKDESRPDSWGVSDSFFACTEVMLAPGGEYSVLQSHRTAERLTFEIAPAEIWQPWCASRNFMADACLPPNTCTDDPTVICPCGASGCQPNVGYRMSLDFTVHGDSMETLVQREGELRMQRVQ
jgi:hypothetical protein